ncbi:MAG: hypothetical protein V3R94_09570 [Acidobacteriota bacterium]
MTDRVKATFLVLLIFAGGVVLGGVLTFFLLQPRFSGPGRDFSEDRQSNRDQFQGAMDRLSDRLGLDESQRRQLDLILRESRQNLNQLNQQVNRRNRTVREGTQEQIRQILDPEQMEQFEEFLTRQSRNRRQRPRPSPGQRRPPPDTR